MVLGKVIKWLWELSPLPHPSKALSFHDSICVKALGLPVLATTIPRGQWIKLPDLGSQQLNTDGSSCSMGCSGGVVVRDGAVLLAFSSAS